MSVTRIIENQDLLKILVESGSYFGHRRSRRNPKMNSYIYSERNGVDIIDLRQTVLQLQQVFELIGKVVGSGGRLLFVGTKTQARDIVAEEAVRCGQHYVNYRWLGGTLTNRKTIAKSIQELSRLDEMMGSNKFTLYTKKEQQLFERKRQKLERGLGGIRDMGGLPNLIFVVDVCEENIAVREARKLGIPVVGIVDTNGNPDVVDYPIPGNDDSHRSIRAFSRLIGNAVLAGLQKEVGISGSDQQKIEADFFKDLPPVESDKDK
jgi:small subunit ribosomal protein S2